MEERKMTVIEFAEARLREEWHNYTEPSNGLYWAAYLDGAKAQRAEHERGHSVERLLESDHTASPSDDPKGW